MADWRTGSPIMSDMYGLPFAYCLLPFAWAMCEPHPLGQNSSWSASQGVRQNCMTNKFCVSQTVDIFYAAELYDNAVWPGCRGDREGVRSSGQVLASCMYRFLCGCSAPSPNGFPAGWLGKILIFINVGRMQSWQFVKASRKFPGALRLCVSVWMAESLKTLRL